jgi:hypothetical protein
MKTQLLTAPKTRTPPNIQDALSEAIQSLSDWQPWEPEEPKINYWVDFEPIEISLTEACRLSLAVPRVAPAPGYSPFPAVPKSNLTVGAMPRRGVRY